MTEQHKAGFSVAVFAHNLEGQIGACIESILVSAGDQPCAVYVLVNGCTDGTERVVLGLQATEIALKLVSIPLADKANAWNHYVHELAPPGAVHFFVDGDVRVQPGAMSRIAAAMDRYPAANAVGGVPCTGRDREAWVRRMNDYGRVSGGLYALRDSFVRHLRHEGIAMPVGFIGDDFLVSALAKNMAGRAGIYTPSPLLQVENDAGFSFRVLSPLRMADYRAYLARLVRYRIRDYQLSMLLHKLSQHGFKAMPASVRELYGGVTSLPRYHWRGRQTPVDWLAVRRIRSEVMLLPDDTARSK